MPRTLGSPSSSFTRKLSASKPRSMTCKTKTVSMNIDSRGWVWLQIWGSRRLDHPSMMVSLCLGRWTTSLHHQQIHHHHPWGKRYKHMGMGTPLGNCQAWGSAPVSYHIAENGKSRSYKYGKLHAGCHSAHTQYSLLLWWWRRWWWWWQLCFQLLHVVIEKSNFLF